MCELTHGMAGERHGRGMLCVNPPFVCPFNIVLLFIMNINSDKLVSSSINEPSTSKLYNSIIKN